MRAGEGIVDSVSAVVVHFRVNSSILERDYMDNAWALAILDRTFRNRELLSSLDYMVITATSSPEGYEVRNEELASKRALAVKSYIMWKFPYVNRDMIYTFSAGEDWEGLRREVENDPYVPGQWEVLYLLDSYQSNNAKKTALRKIAGGRAYSYISHFILPSLRGGVALSLYAKTLPQPPAEPEKKIEERTIIVEKIVRDTVWVERTPTPQPVTPPQAAQPVETPRPVQSVEVAEPATFVRKPLFAFKTNLLFDIGTAVNIEMEIPLGRRWSLAGEWMFPWWLWSSDQIAFEGGVGTLELRSYLGRRKERQPLTGWFLGLHGGAGRYDIEWTKRGVQGKMWYGGLSAGYAHTVNRSGTLRMEYSLGLGYMKTDYTEYVPVMDNEDNWHLERQKEATRWWGGPTRLKISLVWLLDYKCKTRGGAQ
jgi:hypothetical protein